jgi:hypothetical protein
VILEVLFLFLIERLEAVGDLFPASTGLPFEIPMIVFQGYAWLDGMLPVHEALGWTVFYYVVFGILAAYGFVRELRRLLLP